MFQTNQTAAMLEFQTIPARASQPLSFVKTLTYIHAGHGSENSLTTIIAAVFSVIQGVTMICFSAGFRPRGGGGRCGHPDPERGSGLQNFFRPFGPQLACFRLSDTGEDAKEKGTRKVALSQFSGPDYLGAWNRLGLSLV